MVGFDVVDDQVRGREARVSDREHYERLSRSATPSTTVSAAMDVTPDRVERALAAVTPFVDSWKLQLNREDLEEIIVAILSHADSASSFEEIERAVRRDLEHYEKQQRAFQRDAYGS